MNRGSVMCDQCDGRNRDDIAGSNHMPSSATAMKLTNDQQTVSVFNPSGSVSNWSSVVVPTVGNRKSQQFTIKFRVWIDPCLIQACSLPPYMEAIFTLISVG